MAAFTACILSVPIAIGIYYFTGNWRAFIGSLVGVLVLVAVPVLLGLGVTELSVVPTLIPQLKAQVRSLTLESCRKIAARALTLESAEQVRAS